MPITTVHQKVQTNIMYRPQQYIHHPHQLGHVRPGLSLLVSVCIFMLPMLGLVDEHVQLATMYQNPINQWNVHQRHMTFSHTPMVLPSLSSVLPVMILQNRTVRLNVRCPSCTSSPSGVCHVSPVRCLNLPSGLVRRAVLVLLLLLSGDIETNPGPVGQQLTVDDLHVVIKELYNVRANWNNIGVQLRVSIGTLNAIKEQYSDPSDCLRETLTAWLKSSLHSEWGDVVGALSVLGEVNLAAKLEHKYKPYLTSIPIHPQPVSKTASNATPHIIDPASSQPPQLTSGPTPSTPAPPDHPSPQYSEGQHPPPSRISDRPTPSPDQEVPSTTPPHNSAQKNTALLDEQSVELKMKELEVSFGFLVLQAYKELLERKVDEDVRSFRSIFLSLDVSRKYLHQTFIEDNLKIDQETTFDDLWTKLAFYWNFLNFDLLEHVINMFSIKILKHKMASYKDDLKCFRKATRLCVFVSCWPLNGEIPPETEFREFVTKIDLDWEKCTLEDIETKKKVFICKFLLPEYALRPEKIKKGCIAITWLVPAPFVNALQNDIKGTTSEFFKKERIVAITIDGQECYPTPTRKPVEYQQDTTQSVEEPQQSEKPDKIHSDTSKQETLKETQQSEKPDKIHSDTSKQETLKETQQSEKPDKIHSDTSKQETLKETHLTKELPSDMSTSMVPSKIQLGTLTQTLPSRCPPKHKRKQFASETYAREKCVDKIPSQVKLLPSVEQYLSKAEVKADPSLPTKYKDYLSSTPGIRAALYTTFNASMAAEVFTWSQHDKLLPPTTMTELFTAFTLKTVVNHLSTSSVHHKQITTISDLPPKVCKQLQDLCRMAYEGILNEQQLVFSVPTEFAPLGLMKIIPQRYSEGRAASYHFINLTLQEYLAAIHISRFPMHDQTILIRQHLDSDHFKVTLRFLTGLTKLASIPLEKVMESDNAKLTYSHLLFEGKQTTVTTRTLEMVIKSHYSWTPLDYYTTGHAISHLNCPWRLNFSCSFIDDDKFELFCQGCAAHGGTGCRGHILQANFNNNKITSKSIQSFVNIPVEELLLSGNPIGSGSAVKVIKALRGSGVKKLELYKTGIGEPDCEALCELLKSSHSLQYLLIGKNNLSSESVTSIITGLSYNRSLTELDISKSHFKMKNVTNLASVLTDQSKCTLTSLMLKDCHISGQGAAALLENTTLRTLDLDHNPIGGVSTLAIILVENKTLTQLWLKDCHIRSEGAVELAAALCNNSTLKDLDLDCNPIGAKGASSMSDMLLCNISLEVLNLCDDSVGKEGVRQLINSLKHNQTLRRLWLPIKYKTETGDQRISWWC